MIEIKNIHKSFGTLEVLKGVDLTVKKGRADTDPNCLRYQAEQLMRPYLKDGFVFQGV